MDEWLPMETAPRNEDDVLLWVGRVEIGYFSSIVLQQYLRPVAVSG